mgnify:CR=1 FL=1
MIKKEYQICNFCIMDTSDKDIQFDKEGICNHCKNYFPRIKKNLIPEQFQEKKLSRLVSLIKKTGKNKKYDCIVGVSGGVDSSYVALLAKKLKLRTLLVHMDNGWNSKTSIKNIKNLCINTKFDLFTYVINWNEFKDLQLSLFKASVVDIELATDHAIKAVLYKLAHKFNVKYLLNGGNIRTECIMPKSWRHTKADRSNILDIHTKFGSVKLKTFPFAGAIKRQLYQSILGIKDITLLNYFSFKRDDVIQQLKKELGWIEYEGKHHESIFTRFYQAYILPKKFLIDKRRCHLSNLICTGLIDRNQALLKIKGEVYDQDLLKKDKYFVMKKLGFDKSSFNEYINQPPVSHHNFKSDENLIKNLLFFKIYFLNIKKIIFDRFKLTSRNKIL